MPYKNPQDPRRKEVKKRSDEKHKENLQAYRDANKDKKREYMKKYYVSHKEHIRRYNSNNRERLRESAIEYKIEHYRRLWSCYTLGGHRRYGYNVTITPDELHEIALKTERCFYCNELIDWSPRKGKLNVRSPSLDRSNNEKEMRIDNVKIICHLCNTTKQQRTHEEFLDYCYQIAARFEKIEKCQVVV